MSESAVRDCRRALEAADADTAALRAEALRLERILTDPAH